MNNYTPLNIAKLSETVEKPQAILRQDGTPIEIRKPAKYNKLKKLIRAGKFISARITAKAIGVSKDTIQHWLQTPQVQQAVQDEIDYSVRKMKGSEDWRAHDRLIQYATGQDDKTPPASNNILIINNGKEFKIEEQEAR